MRNCIVRELQAITPIRGKDLVTVTRYLQGKQLKSLSQINLQMLEEYHGFIATEYEGKSERGHYGALLETTVLYHLSPAFQNLICEIDEKSKLSRAESNKLKMFLMVAKIHMLREITFETRKKFDAYLRKTGFINKNEYLKALDRLKLASIREENERNPNIVPKLYYASREIYLGYHPDYRIAMEFYYIRDKEELVFDFSINAAEQLKRQIFRMLVHSLGKEIGKKNRRELYLVPLKKLFHFCADQGISDIEQMDADQIKAFRLSMDGKVGTKTGIYMQIVNSTRKFLFMSSKKINWDANVWYMDRIPLKVQQMNPANHVECFRFLQIRDHGNRSMFKQYIKYLLFDRRIGISTIQSRYYCIHRFLLYCEEKQLKAARMSAGQIEAYCFTLAERETEPATYNQAIDTLASFIGYLIISGMAERISIDMNSYKRTGRTVHHNRMIDPGKKKDFLRETGSFPENLRLMCLHIWATGIRVSEVCTIKAADYAFDGEEATLTVTQHKVASRKTIPLSIELYQYMKAYIIANGIGPDEYVFKSKKGRAYDASTFRVQVQRLCRESDFLYRPHDFRHCIATELYENGVDTDEISAFLGHKNKDMTGRYIDISDSRIDEANAEYYRDHSWNTKETSASIEDDEEREE